MKVIDPGHVYELDSDQVIEFIKRTDGELVHAGTTNEELLEVLLNRMEHLNNKFPCFENVQAIAFMAGALNILNERTKKRVAQGVETQDKAHVS